MREKIQFQEQENKPESAMEKRNFVEQAHKSLIADVPLEEFVSPEGTPEQEKARIAKDVLVNAFVIFEGYNFLTPEEKIEFLMRERQIISQARTIQRFTSGDTNWEQTFKNFFEGKVPDSDKTELRRRRKQKIH